jgi:hypothetical protein
VKQVNRRDFLKIGGTGLAGVAAFPFLGRMALASTSNFFTIAVISDTQNYCDGSDTTHLQPQNVDIFVTQAQYLSDNRSNLKLRFVTHVGDVVQKGDGSVIYGAHAANSAYNGTKPQNYEWLHATEAIDILDASGLPFGLVPGNHDYDNMYHTSGTISYYPPLVATPDWWKNYFGSNSKYFRGKSWYVGASDDVGYISAGSTAGKSATTGYYTGEYPSAGTPCNYGLSSAQIFSAGGRKFLHISLEMEAGDAAIAWAQGVIDTYKNYATIVTTHSFLSPPNWGDNKAPLGEVLARNTPSYLNGSPSGWNSADQVFTKLIYPNPQIFLVLCGHSWTSTSSATTSGGPGVAGISKGEYVRIDNNIAGNPVYQVLSDYQGNTVLGSAGGDGWYRFMQFDLTTNSIHFYTINAPESTKAGQPVLAGKNTVYSSDGMSDLDQPEGFSDFSLALPAQVLDAPAGAH